MASHDNLPDVTSPSIVLTQPTEAERFRVWEATHPEWGTALSIEQYVGRERCLLSTPLSLNGGNTAWLLTDGTLKPNERPILATCETYRKRAWVKSRDGPLKEVTAHGVASVFTFVECRNRGYAGKMMELLGKKLDALQRQSEGEAAFSVLYSDVGKQFYAARGWKPVESTHLLFSSASSSVDTTTDASLKPITKDDLAALAVRDTKLLHDKLSASHPSKMSVALVPDLNSLKWHHAREEFVCDALFSRSPTVHGALYAPSGSPNSRVWIIWSHSFYGGVGKPEKNTLHIIRLVIEDDSISDDTLTRAIKATIGLAQKEARDWTCAKVDLWNPSERVKKLTEVIKELNAEYVVREDDGIASLQWFGSEQPEDFEWVANEYYGWC